MVLSVLATAGLVAATIYHFSVQYPSQASLITTVNAFSLISAIHLTLLFGPTGVILYQGIGRRVKYFFVFISVYVGT